MGANGRDISAAGAARGPVPQGAVVGAQAQYREPVTPELDELTGLPTLSHLVEQIQELQAEMRARPGPRRSVLPRATLVVVSLASGVDRHMAQFVRARTASLLRALFADDETIVQMRQGMFAVLTSDGRDMAPECSFLESMLVEFDVDARVWTERVPADGPGTASLLSALLLAGEWTPA